MFRGAGSLDPTPEELQLARNTQCEGCRASKRKYAWNSNAEPRWCYKCTVEEENSAGRDPDDIKQGDMVNLLGQLDKQCEDCHVDGADNRISHGLSGKQQWCFNCSMDHPGARLIVIADPAWEAQLAKLVAYKAAHGDCNVPKR
jgi:hypothetical protein